MLVVWGEVVPTGAGLACGLFFPGPGVGDVCVGPGDDKRQDEDGHDDDADACGSDAHGILLDVVVFRQTVVG